MRARERGLTLLEVLVAFAIAALALSLLVRGGLDGLFAAGISDRYAEAVSRARSHLAALEAGQLVAADRQGDEGEPDAGRQFHWHVRIVPVARVVRGGDVIGGLPESLTTLYAISVVVSWRESGRSREVQLDSDGLGTVASVRGLNGP